MKLSRRNFLARSAAAAGVIGIAPPALLAHESRRVPGIQLYSVDEAMMQDTAGTLRKIHEFGYREVETAGFGTLSAVEFRKFLDDTGLRCDSCHLSFDGEDFGSEFEEAQAVGARYVVSSMLIDFSTVKTVADAQAVVDSIDTDAFRRIIDKANRIGEAAAQAGLKYAYHNHNFEFKMFGGAVIGYDLLIKETDAKLVSLELDCGWAGLAGYDPVKYLQAYPERIRMLHLKNFVKGEAAAAADLGEHQSTELDRGFIDYQPILAAAKRAGVEHYFVEQEPPFKGITPLEAALRNYRYLRARL